MHDRKGYEQPLHSNIENIDQKCPPQKKQKQRH